MRNRWPRPARCLTTALCLGAPAYGQGMLLATPGDLIDQKLGSTVAFAGDVNGDGVTDLIAACPQLGSHTAPFGRVRVLSGVDGSLLQSVDGAPLDAFGTGVAGGFDLDSDGRPDWIAGAPQISYAGSGLVHAGYARAHSGATGAPILQLPGVFGDALGYSVDGGPDIDLDGVPDLLVGARQGGLVSTGPGYARIYSGATGIPIRTLTGPVLGGHYGFVVDLFDDVDGDGVGDLAIGAPISGAAGFLSGLVDVISGATGVLLFRFQGATPGDNVGYAVVSPGDLDNDGLADVIIAASGDDTGAANAGALYARRGFDGAPLYVVNGMQADGALGSRLSAGPDFDGDGVRDWVTAQGAFTTDSVELRSGATGALVQEIHAITGGFGLLGALDALGDVNGDGIGDLLVGTPYADLPGAPNVGGVAVWSTGCGKVSIVQPACPGGGLSFTVSGCPVGNGAVELGFDNGVPLAPGLLVFGTTQGSTSLPGGCTLGVGGVPIVIPFVLDALGAAGSGIDLPTPIASLTVFLQAVLADAMAPGGVTATTVYSVAFP